ncbi:MAG TPA: pantoate--beta-alanine ligase [Dehalococcoidia bacterium]|nr:pantoate--beta-alanine ligase [Dehalococcoidia bacterium]
MKVFSTIAQFKEARQKVKGSVGFVPTMGYLHEGHLTLARQARGETNTVVASIFVNPTQFGPAEDLAQYPRDPERDLTLLEKERVDLVFMPTASEMYPQGFSSWVEVEKVTEGLEGAVRPGHFRGVATVVAKLFNIVEPTRAYFGQKDAQQVVVVKKMVADLNMNLEVVIAPTVREPDGLAMSSRNTFLNPEERKAAPVLWKSLNLAQQFWSQGERQTERIRQQMTAFIQKEPLARIDYISIADSETLEELVEIDRPALVSLAVRIGKTRLIDNITLGVVGVKT